MKLRSRLISYLSMLALFLINTQIVFSAASENNIVHVKRFVEKDHTGFITKITTIFYDRKWNKIAKNYTKYSKPKSSIDELPKEKDDYESDRSFMGSASFKEHLSLVWYKHCLEVNPEDKQ